MRLFTSRLGKHLVLMAALSMISAAGFCKESDWPLWEAYKARFIDAQGRVFDPIGDQHSTSEGQAYGMFFALVDNDRPTFDHVLAWTQANLAGGDLHAQLPAWIWGKDKNGQWKPLDPNPASDADVWMAYALLEAGRLWGDASYTSLGRAMVAHIAKSEVANLPGLGFMLLPGPMGFQHDKSWTLNPSYLPLFVFERLAHVDPAGPWQGIALNIPRLMAESARHGFIMDWVDYFPGDGFYPSGPQNANAAGQSTGGSYDAIRVYLWAGMTAAGKPREEMLNAASGMTAYLTQHDFPPERVNNQGIPLGNDGPVGFSAAVLPYLRAFPGMSRSSAKQMIRMNAERSVSTGSFGGLYGKDMAYYDQNLVLFGTGFIDDRFEFGPAGELNVDWKRQ